MTLKDLNTGSYKGFHATMLAFALAKFGSNPSKVHKDTSSWAPTADDYANILLDFFVGVTTAAYGSINCRLFLRALLARELGMYLLTGVKTEGLYESVRALDRMYWSAQCPGSLNTLALPQHIN